MTIFIRTFSVLHKNVLVFVWVNERIRMKRMNEVSSFASSSSSSWGFLTVASSSSTVCYSGVWRRLHHQIHWLQISWWRWRQQSYQDVLASFLFRWSKWRHVGHLYTMMPNSRFQSGFIFYLSGFRTIRLSPQLDFRLTCRWIKASLSSTSTQEVDGAVEEHTLTQV